MAVLTIANDVGRTTVLGGHDRQAACRRLDQRQAKGLGQRGVDKNATRACRQAIQHSHLLRFVVFWVRKLAIQIMFVDGQQEFILEKNISDAVNEVRDYESYVGIVCHEYRMLPLMSHQLLYRKSSNRLQHNL